MIIVLILILSLGISGISQTKESSRQETAIAETRVSLTPPSGFAVAPEVSGYSQESSSSSIIVTEFPASFSETKSAFNNPSGLLKRGMTLLNKLEVNLNEQKGELLKVKQIKSGVEYLKLILIFGDEKESVMIIGTFPKVLENELSEKMKASLLTANWHKEKKVSPIAGLTFTFAEKGELKLAKRIVNALIFTKSGIFPSRALDDPMFIIAPTLSNVDIDDKEEFAKARVSQTATITNIEIEKLSQIGLDDLNGYEIIATGKDVESGQPMVIYQTILFEDLGYYLMQGLISEKQSQTYLPAFKDMARSFKRKK